MDSETIRAAEERHAGKGSWVVHDVNLTLWQCRLGVLEWEKTVKQRANEPSTEANTGDLLTQRLGVIAAKGNCRRLRKG